MRVKGRSSKPYCFGVSDRGKIILFRFSFFIGVVIFLFVMVFVPYGMNTKVVKDDEAEKSIFEKKIDFKYQLSNFMPLKKLNKEFINRTTEAECVNIECRFICINSRNLSKSLEAAFKETNCTAIDNLQVEDYILNNKTVLYKNFFETNLTIYELGLHTANITLLSNEIFNRQIFINTFTLILEIPNLKKLSSGLLLGLIQLKYLTVYGNIEYINRAFLQPVRSTIKHLKINGMSELVQFDHIFGINVLTNLYHLDASDNFFTEPIKKSTFTLLPKLQYLNLANSNIQVIEDGAFEAVWSTLKFLDISQNKITHIYDLSAAFQYKPIYMHVRDNDWTCNCKLYPFVKIFQEYRDHILDIAYCKYPQKFYGVTINAFKYKCENQTEENEPTTNNPETTQSNIENVDRTSSKEIASKESDVESVEYTTAGGGFPGKTSPSTPSVISTTPIITQTSSQKPDKEFQSTTRSSRNDKVLLQCSKTGNKVETFSNIDVKSESQVPSLNPEDFIYIQPPIYDFDVYLKTNTSIKVIIKDNDMDIRVVWYGDPNDFNMHNDLSKIDSEKPHDYGCKKRDSESLVIENLIDDKTYTICLMKDGVNEISPFDCIPIHIPKRIEFIATDLDNEDSFIIALICLGVIISTSLGMAVSFFVIKSYPHLLEGSKKVLVVKKSKKDKEKIKNAGNNSIKKKNLKIIESATPSTSPFYISHRDHDIDSAYETPVDSDIDKKPAVILSNRINLPKFFIESPKCPPPLPKRNSEHIYGTIRTPVLKAKRSI